jgi:hypothetical protein
MFNAPVEEFTNLADTSDQGPPVRNEAQSKRYNGAK